MCNIPNNVPCYPGHTVYTIEMRSQKKDFLKDSGKTREMCGKDVWSHELCMLYALTS